MNRDEATAFCDLCDEHGIAVSSVTGARGTCRHPHVTYRGHEAESWMTPEPPMVAPPGLKERIIEATRPTEGDDE